MKTELQTKDIPAIIGLNSKATGRLMDQMGREYCRWWCGQANGLDAELLFQNQDFQDWWIASWLVQDQRFLTYAVACMQHSGSITSATMLLAYLKYHRPCNEEVKADGELVLWKTMLPMPVQQSWAREIGAMKASVRDLTRIRSIRDLINSISDN